MKTELKRFAHNLHASLTGGKKWYRTFAQYLDAKYDGPYSATDAIIRMSDDNGIEGVVLIERKFEPYGVAFPGGIAEKMSFEENTIKEAKEETGLHFILDSPEQPYRVTSKVNNDARAHISSNYFTGVGVGVIAPAPDEDALSARLIPMAELSDLVQNETIWASKSHLRVIRAYVTEHSDIVAKYGWYE